MTLRLDGAGAYPVITQHEKAGPSLTRLIAAKPQKTYGALGRIRTSDPQIRSLMLYPAELRAHLVEAT
jgi:hypothetical protein